MTLGLTSAEAAERKIQGLDNRVDLTSSRSIQDIFAANFLSIANIILLVIVVVLVAVGKPGDAFVTGGIVIINVFIGTFQEFRAKRKLDQIALLSRPHDRVIRDGQEIDSQHQLFQTEGEPGIAVHGIDADGAQQESQGDH